MYISLQYEMSPYLFNGKNPAMLNAVKPGFIV